MINCLVIDDEQHAIDVLEHYIRETGVLRLAASTDNPLTALAVLRDMPIDLIFLDIHMPPLSGIDFIKAIHQRYRVVLCTAYPNYAVEGFELDVLDYLVKPIPMGRFMKTVQRAVDYFEGGRSAGAAGGGGAVAGALSGTGAAGAASRAVSGDVVAGAGVSRVGAATGGGAGDYIMVKTDVKGKMLKINLSDILFVEGMKNYVAIHHGSEKTMVLLPMKELEERLPAANFMRVHKSFIVSLSYITMIEGNTISVRNRNEKIPVGEAYRERFMETMREKLLGR